MYKCHIYIYIYMHYTSYKLHIFVEYTMYLYSKLRFTTEVNWRDNTEHAKQEYILAIDT